MSVSCFPTKDNFIPVTIKENNFLSGISKVVKAIRPNWPTEDIKYKTFTDGITNKLVACHLKSNNIDEEDTILVRIYGNKTDLLIDRTAEVRNIKTLHVLGLAPALFAVFENGLAYQYYPGKTLNVESVLDVKIWPLVARQMARMHKVQLPTQVSKEPMVWSKTEQFMRLLPEPFSVESKQARFANSFGSVRRLRTQFENLKFHFRNVKSPIVFAHNDLLLGNVIYNGDKETLSFIDYEYAAYNYQAYDIANHFNEFVGLTIEDINYDRYPSKKFQMAWIETYLSEYLNTATPAPAAIEQVYKEVQQFALASHFLWGIWSLVQYELSDIDFDFGKYAEIRLDKYWELKFSIYEELS